MKPNEFDLLTTVEYGGCSAKLAPGELSRLLSGIPLLKDSNVLVDIETHDDAGVYRIDDQRALVVTTDFFPPVCSSAFDFGAIAAANSLSDVYAMGGKPLLVLNLNMFPSKKIPLEVLRDILLGGQSKINESGAFTMGGHTIDDEVPKYGLAVVGMVHPDRVITNKGAQVGQRLVLTKPLGTGIAIAAQRLGLATEETYRSALAQMMRLNDKGSELMQQFGVKGATDVTGFGLAGHAYKMAEASGVSLVIDTAALPVIAGCAELIADGCVPGAVFRNLDFVKEKALFDPALSLTGKMIAADAQTSGGLLCAVDADKADRFVSEMRVFEPDTAIIGEVIQQQEYLLKLI